MNRLIRVGSGNSYTDIGIEPPLHGKGLAELDRRYQARADSNNPLAIFITGYTIENRGVEDQDDTKKEHTLLSFNSGDMCRANSAIYEKLASGIADVAVAFLVEIGDSVETLERPIPIDGQHGLFGGHAEEIINYRVSKRL